MNGFGTEVTVIVRPTEMMDDLPVLTFSAKFYGNSGENQFLDIINCLLIISRLHKSGNRILNIHHFGMSIIEGMLTDTQSHSCCTFAIENVFVRQVMENVFGEAKTDEVFLDFSHFLILRNLYRLPIHVVCTAEDICKRKSEGKGSHDDTCQYDIRHVNRRSFDHISGFVHLACQLPQTADGEDINENYDRRDDDAAVLDDTEQADDTEPDHESHSTARVFFHSGFTLYGFDALPQADKLNELENQIADGQPPCPAGFVKRLLINGCIQNQHREIVHASNERDRVTALERCVFLVHRAESEQHQNESDGGEYVVQTPEIQRQRRHRKPDENTVHGFFPRRDFRDNILGRQVGNGLLQHGIEISFVKFHPRHLPSSYAVSS